MGAILGLGMTHVPLLAGRDQDMSRILRRVLQDPDLPKPLRTPDGWPEAMRQEWGDDEGLAAARRHREALLTWCRKTRKALDDFAPDLVVVWGDDQYENFMEDIIPPFCVLAYDAIEHRPWAEAKWGNIWEEPKDTTFAYKGHRAAAKRLTSGLLEAGFDVSYAYRPLHHPLGHAFMNTLLFLDYDRQG
ncbi:MAG TPA: extradiol ring-cleavage dioxygenase, partial [Candidatus Binatia bacterium]|nr:extradiol ring-cleavage dioxygenase [Candidatus Binatia bacterium]